MMYSDYYAISSCAFSVVFIPFMILAGIRFCLSLQAFNYSNRYYFRWLACSYRATGLPLAFICAIAIVAQQCLRIYLTNTSFNELMIIIFYAVWLLLASLVLIAGFARYTKVLGKAMWHVPRVADRRIHILFICSSLILSVIVLILNLRGWRAPIYFLPLATPLFAPLVNLFLKPFPGAVKMLANSFDEEDWNGGQDFG